MGAEASGATVARAAASLAELVASELVADRGGDICFAGFAFFFDRTFFFFFDSVAS